MCVLTTLTFDWKIGNQLFPVSNQSNSYLMDFLPNSFWWHFLLKKVLKEVYSHVFINSITFLKNLMLNRNYRFYILFISTPKVISLLFSAGVLSFCWLCNLFSKKTKEDHRLNPSQTRLSSAIYVLSQARNDYDKMTTRTKILIMTVEVAVVVVVQTK